MSNPITTAVNLVHALDKPYNYAEAKFIIEQGYSDDSLVHVSECPHCRCPADIGLGHCQNCGCEWCPTHICTLAEGGYCVACEAIADIQQAIGMRMKFYVNNYYTKYYMAGTSHRGNRVQPRNLVKYIEECWTLSYEQCLLDLMQDGYSMCVVSPMIIAIHARMDREYAEYCERTQQ